MPNTANFDLFAVQLWGPYDSGNASVLAYKQGDRVCGVGGWAGTATESKQLYFFTASINGDTWTVEDAGAHNVYIGGSIAEGSRLQLKKVTGII